MNCTVNIIFAPLIIGLTPYILLINPKEHNLLLIPLPHNTPF